MKEELKKLGLGLGIVGGIALFVWTLVTLAKIYPWLADVYAYTAIGLFVLILAWALGGILMN